MRTVATAPPVGPGAQGVRLGVPWGTVLPLAAVAAFGNGFWLVAVRGAVGATERTTHPFTVWWQESALLLPLHVFAVLAAVTLALRWFGPGPRRARAVVTTLALVVLASTLAALGVQAANAVYDYRLQVEEVVTLAAHTPICDAACVADRQKSALLLQVRALGLNGSVMLVSNLVLLGLVVAFRGGRLDVAAGQRLVASSDNRARGRFVDSRTLLTVCLVGTAAIHAAVSPGQLADWPAAGVFFAVLCIVEVGLAVQVLARFRPATLRAVALLSAGTVMLWVDSRSDGLSFGPGAGVAPPVGLADGAATLLEVATLVLAVTALRRHGWPLRPWAPQHRANLAVVSVVAVTCIGLGGGLGVFGGAVHPVQPGGTGGGGDHPVQHSASTTSP